jgi:hypothetical protein
VVSNGNILLILQIKKIENTNENFLVKILKIHIFLENIFLKVKVCSTIFLLMINPFSKYM